MAKFGGQMVNNIRFFTVLQRGENSARSLFQIVLFGLLSVIAAACNGSSSGPPPGPTPSSFPQPEVRESMGGSLKTTLHAKIADNMLVDQFSHQQRLVHTPTYEGTIPGPTLSVKPGDTLSIDLVNDLPANPTVQREGFYPHDPYTTNLHTHGLSVSPLNNSDNIYREMPPGSTNPIRIEIPATHPSGTYWYHPHKHGSVTFQLISGMAGFLIVKGGPGTLDTVPEVAAAKDIVMGFQVIRTAIDGTVPFVSEIAQLFGTLADDPQQGIWSTFGVDGAPGRSYFYYTTNGVTNPTLHMRPGEVQRWRLLNASDSDDLLVALQGHGLNIIAMDGITVANMYHLKPGAPVVMGSGQRYDVLVQAGQPGTYQLQALDWTTNPESVSPSPQNIDPEQRASLHSFDFPTPCVATGPLACPPPIQQLSYPVNLATVIIDGPPKNMKLPADALPVPNGLPSVNTMVTRQPDKVRHLAFEICANKAGTVMENPQFRVPSCGWYYAKYGATYWGGTPFNSLLLMRDDDDKGTPSVPFDPNMPLVNFTKDGLFNPAQPLFGDMIAGNYEEWTVVNRSFSDHPFHIHQNPFLVTAVNNIPLSPPEWHDTFLVPGSKPMPSAPSGEQPNINSNFVGSITFRTYFEPQTVGCFVAHCHIITHEDIGMMQRLDILPGPGLPSGCGVDSPATAASNQ